MKARALYLAMLRVAADRDEEMLGIQAISFAMFYSELRSRHDVAVSRERLCVTRNSAFATWNESANDGDESDTTCTAQDTLAP